MYGGSGVSPAGSPSRRRRQRPSPRCSSSSTGPYRRPALSRRVGRASASHVPSSRRSSRSTSPRGDSIGILRRHDLRVVDDDELPGQLVRQLSDGAMANRAGRALVDEQPRRVATLGRMLRDQLRRQLVFQLARGPSDASCTVARVDLEAIARAQQRIEDAAAGRDRPRRVRRDARARAACRRVAGRNDGRASRPACPRRSRTGSASTSGPAPVTSPRCAA